MSARVKRREGFTLVELAIVLVIIGLLIGGILVAQSMIATAKILTQVRQLQQIDIATSNFFTKVSHLPGDFSGDKDGWVDYGYGGAFDSACTIGTADGTDCSWGMCNIGPEGECAYFFSDLANIVSFPGTYDPTVNRAASYGNGTAFPSAAIGTGGILLSQNQQKQLFWFLMGTLPSGYIFTGGPNAAIPSTQAVAIDAKIDDGFANSGNVVIAQPNAWADRSAQYPLYSQYAADCNQSSDHALYDTTTDPNNPHCNLQIKSNATLP